jgi:hypothetical protein
MDESPKQLIKQTRIPIERKPGSDAKEDFEYERCGVANIFMVNEPLAGKRVVKVTERKTKIDWAYLIKEIADEHYPTVGKIRLVMDNLATHKAGALYEAFQPEEAKRIWDRFEFIYTPKHGSWINMGATFKADVVIVSISLIKGNRETYHSVGSSLPRHARRVIFGCEAREIMYRIAARLSVKAARRELTWKFHPG